MRRVVCRFDDEADFLRQVNSNRHKGELQFLAEFSLESGEDIRVTTLVSRLREQLDLHMTIVESRPVAVDRADGTRLFRYRARVAPQDAPWLEMFARKMSMSHGVEAAA